MLGSVSHDWQESASVFLLVLDSACLQALGSPARPAWDSTEMLVLTLAAKLTWSRPVLPEHHRPEHRLYRRRHRFAPARRRTKLQSRSLERKKFFDECSCPAPSSLSVMK
jgi:hypothetical protein